MRYLNFLALNDAYFQRITPDDIEPIELGQAYERIIEPLRVGKLAVVKRGTSYTATGSIGSKRATITIHDENVPIAVIAICLHSRTATPLWRELYQGSNLPDLPPPAAPWVGVRYDVPETALPDWLDRLAWHAAWHLLNDE